MSEEIKQPDDVAATEPAPAPAAPEAAPAPSTDPLDQLLADLTEWDQKFPSSPEVPTPAEDAPQAIDWDKSFAAAAEDAQQTIDWQQREAQWQDQISQSQDQLRLLRAQSASTNVQNEAQINQLRGTVNQLQQSIRQAEWQKHVERSQSDFVALAKEEQSKMPADVDERYAETWLLAQAQRDPELARAWEGRYFQGYNPLERAELETAILLHGQNLMAKLPLIANKQQRALAERHVRYEMQRLYEKTFMDPAKYRADCKRYVEKSLAKMHEAARRPRIDVDATETHEAVAAAVRGGGRSIDPPMPALGTMSDKEFKKFTGDNFGF